MEPPEQRQLAPETKRFDLLADAERRHAICALSRTHGPVDLQTLAVMVTARDLGKPTSEVAPEQIEPREIALFHTHLPKLDAYGIVEFHTDARTVELRDTPEVDAVFDFLSDSTSSI